MNYDQDKWYFYIFVGLNWELKQDVNFKMAELHGYHVL